MSDTIFYRVADKPLIPDDHYAYGYEEYDMFSEAVWRLHGQWKGRTGECLEERNDFRKLRFSNPFWHEDVWMPDFLLEPTSVAAIPAHHYRTDAERDHDYLNSLFDFD